MVKGKILPLLIIAVSSFGCTFGEQASPSVTRETSPQPTITNTEGSTPTLSSASPTDTASPSPTPTPFSFQSDCSVFFRERSSNLPLARKGRLLLKGAESGSIYSLDLRSRRIDLLLGEYGYRRIEVSPYNGTIFWLEIIKGGDDVGHFILPDGDMVQYPIPTYWYFIRWLADGRVMFGVLIKWEENAISDNYTVDEFYTLMPETGEIEHHSVPMPDFDWTSRRDSFITYDPTLTKVFFSGRVDGDNKYALRDLKTGQVLWQGFDWFTTFNSGDIKPIWQNSGEKAVIGYVKNTGTALYTVDIKGNEVLILDLSEYYTEGFFLIDGVWWSPNDRYLAFTFTQLTTALNPFTINYLYILDLQTNIVFDYCLRIDRWAIPQWSPESSQIAVQLIDEMIVILDFERGELEFIEPYLSDEASMVLKGWSR